MGRLVNDLSPPTPWETAQADPGEPLSKADLKIARLTDIPLVEWNRCVRPQARGTPWQYPLGS